MRGTPAWIVEGQMHVLLLVVPALHGIGQAHGKHCL